MQVTKEGIERIKAANDRSAVVAERGLKLETNVLIASLASSRCLEEPHAAALQSGLAAGEPMLLLTPEESRVRYSALVGKA